MIELRWVYGNRNMIVESVQDGRTFEREKVLQYRVITNGEEIGLHEPIYSDWQDVPVVGEKTQIGPEDIS